MKVQCQQMSSERHRYTETWAPSSLLWCTQLAGGEQERKGRGHMQCAHAHTHVFLTGIGLLGTLGCSGLGRLCAKGEEYSNRSNTFGVIDLMHVTRLCLALLSSVPGPCSREKLAASIFHVLVLILVTSSNLSILVDAEKRLSFP